MEWSGIATNDVSEPIQDTMRPEYVEPVVHQDSFEGNAESKIPMQQNPYNKKFPKYNPPKGKMFTMWDGNNRENPRKNTEKPGRPILGAGARNYGKGNSFSDKYEANPTGWNAKQKDTGGSRWGGEKSQNRTEFRELRTNKGWEHDDRFDIDYN